jgi:hypothetical protein
MDRFVSFPSLAIEREGWLASWHAPTTTILARA